MKRQFHLGLSRYQRLCHLIILLVVIVLINNSCKSRTSTTNQVAGSGTMCYAVEKIVDAGPDFKSIRGDIRTKELFGNTYSLTIDTGAFVNAYISDEITNAFEGLFYKGYRQTDCFQRYQDVLGKLKVCGITSGITPKEEVLPEELQFNGFGVRTIYELGRKGRVVVIASRNSTGEIYTTRMSIYR